MSIRAVEKEPYLLFTGKNSEMTVMWQLKFSQSCTIRWGKTTAYEMGSSTTTEYGSDHQHKKTIKNLTPNTLYYYTIAGIGSGSFRTAPEANATKTRFITYGDTRTNPDDHNSVTTQILKRVKEEPSLQTVIFFSGDYVSSGSSEKDWKKHFFSKAQLSIMELHANVPNVGAIGNHEGIGGSPVLKKYYPFPHVDGHYWAFDYGPVRVFVIDQYTQAYSPGSKQYNWLQSELAASTKNWNIALFHSPGYSAAGRHVNNSDVQNYLQPLFEEYEVDFVINGDNHYYSRAEVNGVTHITTGGGGAPLYTPDSTNAFVVKSDKSHHFCEFQIDGDSATVLARRADGTIIEKFTVTHKTDN